MATQNYGMVPGGGGLDPTYTGSGKFPSPFYDIASDYVPKNMHDMFRWAEYIYATNGTYRSAARKVVRYFLTEIDVSGPSESECKKHKEFLEQKLHIMQQLAEIGDEFSTYGNVFVSLIFPFDRFLACPDCKTMFHADAIPYKFNLGKLSFSGRCPKCKREKVFKIKDIPSTEPDRVRIKRWNVKDIRLRVHDVSGRVEYFLQLPSKFVQKVRDGNPFYINETPWSMLETIRSSGSDPALYQFDGDSIYHLKEVTLSGFDVQGWGIPPIIANFKLAYYIQLMRKYDEAISMDFITPFRVLFPQLAPGPQGGDALQSMNMNEFVARMQEMVARKRQDATDIQIAPFPIGYQMLGGEGRQLAPKDSVQLATDELLNAVGFPAELYKGTLSVQAAPLALRLFERTFGSLVDGYNDLISWMLKRISSYFLWDGADGKLRSVTLADDLERKGIMLQGAAGQDISKQTAYRAMGLDYMDEQKKVLEEQTKIQEMQQKAMEDQEASQAPGAGGAGGDPMAAAEAGGDVGATPADVRQTAADLANRLLTQMTETQRRSELIRIKHSNPTLHALVKQFMAEQRQMAASQGQQMVLQQGGPQ